MFIILFSFGWGITLTESLNMGALGNTIGVCPSSFECVEN